MPSKDKKPIVKRPPKTLKERRFVKALTTAGSAAEAARIAGYKDPVQSAYENQIKLDIVSVMDKAGLTDDVLVSHLTMGLMDAQKIDQYSGERMPDYQIKHKYLETSLKLKKHLGSDNGGTNNGTVNNFNFGWKS